MLPDFMIYTDYLQYLKTVWYWQKERHTESMEQNSVQKYIHTYIGIWFSTKIPTQFDREKSLSTNSVEKIETSICKN